jgi:hypothetical protein
MNAKEKKAKGHQEHMKALASIVSGEKHLWTASQYVECIQSIYCLIAEEARRNGPNPPKPESCGN